MPPESEARHIPSAINWRRMACPQPDGYDTDAILEMAESRGHEVPQAATGTFWLNDAVLIDPDPGYLAKDAIPAPLDHPNIAIGAELLALWPEIYLQCQKLIHRVAFFVDARHDFDCIVGSVCGPGTDGFGSISTTINNHVGVAEAIVHELAHHKLRATGIDVESADGLVLNDPGELYPSPIRYDSQRPMTAVLHAQYSYVHIAALDIRIIGAGQDAKRDEIIARQSLAVILPKLEFGLHVLDSHARLDAAGADFVAGLDAWTRQVLDDGFAILEKFAVEAVEFRHPLLAERGAGVIEQEEKESSMPTDNADTSWRPRARNDLESHVVSDGMVLYDPIREAAYSLNRESRAIWELCNGERTIEQVAGQLLHDLGADDNGQLLAQLTDDVADTVQKFEADDLLCAETASRD